MKIGNSAHVLLAEARRHTWAVSAPFWDSFARLLTLDRIPVELAAPEAKPARRSGGGRRERSAVAVLPLQGLIMPKASILSMLFGGGGGLAAFRQALREAVVDPDVDAIVLDVDSPGGSSALVEETAAEIRAARDVKPVIAVANVDAASAAYWLASQASELAVTPSGMVGSVGAYILHVDYSGMNEQMGIDPTFVYAGKYKVEGNSEEPLADEAKAHVQAIVDETYSTFVRDVALGRGETEKNVRRGYGEGRMLTAPNALAAGMVDRVATLEEVVGEALDGGSRSSGRRAENPSDAPPTLQRDEAKRDEEPSPAKLSTQVARREDEALADKAIAATAT